MTWTCSACGADNDDSLQVCGDCGGARAGDLAAPQHSEADTWEDKTFEDKETSAESLPEPGDVDEEKEEREEPEFAPAPPPKTVISSPLSSIERTPTPQAAFQITPPSTSQTGGQGRFYLVFVNTPASSLVKSKVPIEFDDFPVITIGRSPENVVVIPDQEVSRKHAELTAEGSRLVLRDLKSKNGTFIYDGKKFQQVSDSVEVGPNSILKFGTGTIVKLVSE